MTGNSVALDTNQAIHVLNDVVQVIAWLGAFSELCLPVTVLGELRFGARKSSRAQSNLAKVESLVARCRVLETVSATADVYSAVRLSLLNKGQPIPENDIWIAAACLEHAVPLVTGDAHFDAVPGLQVLRQP
jgi:tRNA(fMet)-specific endonuclease VapC